MIGRWKSAFVGGLSENETIFFIRRLTLIHCQIFLGNSKSQSKFLALPKFPMFSFLIISRALSNLHLINL